MAIWWKVAAGIGATLALTQSPHAITAILDATSPAAAQRAWARTFLHEAGLPRTPCNLGAVIAWEQAEGGNWNNSAAHNPLNTTMPERGSSSINSAGVQSYPSWRKGLTATVATLNNGNYPRVIAALQAGTNASAAADAVAASPWGTQPFQASC
jgi:hypothetical protein